MRNAGRSFAETSSPLPDTSSSDNKELLRFQLSKYGRMRAGDLFKKIKKHIKDAESGFQENFNNLQSALRPN